LVKATTAEEPVLEMQSGRGAQIRKAKIKLHKVVDVMGWRAIGNKLTDYSKNDQLNWIESEKPSPQAELFE
jgi:topoisomerase-4 subunit A